MKTKRPPKRYASHEAIIAAIDHEQEALASSMKLAEEYEAEARQIQEWQAAHGYQGAVGDVALEEWHGKNERLKLILNEAAIRRRSIPRHVLMLRRLKVTLAQFDTTPMAWVVPDASVLLAGP